MPIRRFKRPRVKVEIESETTSKYFKKEEPEELPGPSNTDTNGGQDSVEYIKSLGSDDYFAFINEKTCDDISPNTKVAMESNGMIPVNFLPIYSKVKYMRSRIKTPVDNVGCAMLPITINDSFGIPQSKLKPKNYRLQLLISLMLSSQTKDETTANAMHNLMEHCIVEINDPDGITLEALISIEEKDLDKEIFSVGFHNRKSSFIKRVAVMLKENFEGDVPPTIEGFLSLPGVGPKMGYLALQKSWAKVDGIGVDVHVDRLAKMWKWVDPKACKTPEHTRKELESWLPRSLWYEINPVLVGFGQVVCMPRSKRCDICLVNDICAGVDRKVLKKGIDNDVTVDKNRGDLSEWIKYFRSHQNFKTLENKVGDEIEMKVETD